MVYISDRVLIETTGQFGTVESVDHDNNVANVQLDTNGFVMVETDDLIVL